MLDQTNKPSISPAMAAGMQKFGVGIDDSGNVVVGEAADVLQQPADEQEEAPTPSERPSAAPAPVEVEDAGEGVAEDPLEAFLASLEGQEVAEEEVVEGEEKPASEMEQLRALVGQLAQAVQGQQATQAVTPSVETIADEDIEALGLPIEGTRKLLDVVYKRAKGDAVAEMRQFQAETQAKQAKAMKAITSFYETDPLGRAVNASSTGDKRLARYFFDFVRQVETTERGLNESQVLQAAKKRCVAALLLHRQVLDGGNKAGGTTRPVRVPTPGGSPMARVRAGADAQARGLTMFGVNAAALERKHSRLTKGDGEESVFLKP